jgi:hypothetical protein
MAILVAAHPAGALRLKKVLAGHELSFVSTMEEAEQVLERGRFLGILLGVQFDESRMLKLLERLRSEKRLPIPVVCIIGIKGRLSEAAVNACKKAASALGAEAVLDLAHFPDDERGNARLRGTILSTMLASRPASVPQDW